MASGADWESIEKEYRAGQLSVRQIARQHDISEAAIRKRVKREGWQRDLTDAVRQEVRARAARTDAEAAASDAEIVDRAAARGVEVVRQHRRDIGQARDVVGKLMGQLADAADGRETLQQTVLAGQDIPEPYKGKLLRALNLQQHASTARDLAHALRALVPLERQAFGLDEDGGDGVEGKPVPKFIMNMGGGEGGPRP